MVASAPLRFGCVPGLTKRLSRLVGCAFLLLFPLDSAVSADGGLAAAREAFARGAHDQAIALLRQLIAESEPGLQRGEAKELLGDCYVAKRQWYEAVKQFSSAAVENPNRAADILPRLVESQEALPVGLARLDALQRRAALEARVVGPGAARATYQRVLTEHDDAVRTFRETTDVHPYQKTRREVDRPLLRASVHRDVARLLQQESRTDAAVAEWETALLTSPIHGAISDSCLQLGTLLSQTKPTKALAYLVRSVDFLGDRARPTTKAKAAENVAFLKAVATPHSGDFLTTLFTHLSALCARLPGLAFPDAPALEDLVAAWSAAEKVSYDRDFEAALGRWAQIGQRSPGTLLERMAHLAAAQWAYNAGLYLRAEREFEAALAEGPAARVLNPLVLYGKGHLALAEGDLAEARDCFHAAGQTGDVAIGALARLRLAETLEALGEVGEARVHLRALEKQHANEYFAHMAALALKRLDEHEFSELRRPPAERRALYLGEDRQTQGDWRIYGRDAFILCASNGLTDLCGGTRWPFGFRAYLGTGDKIWWWSGGDDAHPSMLYNPSKGRVGACNWDDGGEKQQVAAGPDMLLDLDIPAGRFRLSLYFVNDHSYFEPNREYTVYLLDREADGKVLAACPVRDFLQGVYEHFAVVGPRRITMRAFRKMSLNVIMTAVFLDEIGGLPEWESLTEGMAPNAIAGGQQVRKALALAADESAPLNTGLTVGRALTRTARIEKAAADFPPWQRAAAAWMAFRDCADSGCGRSYHTSWLRRCYDAVQAAAAPGPARKWLASVSERLLESGYVGDAQILDAMVYPLDDAGPPQQSVTVPLALAERYAEIVQYHTVPNRGMPPRVSVRK
ncbi:MAG: hypothetical protein ACE5O2_08220, partial [Armatimonadota bacterium]